MADQSPKRKNTVQVTIELDVWQTKADVPYATVIAAALAKAKEFLAGRATLLEHTAAVVGEYHMPHGSCQVCVDRSALGKTVGPHKVLPYELCPECNRSYGPHYRGPCEHGGPPAGAEQGPDPTPASAGGARPTPPTTSARTVPSTTSPTEPDPRWVPMCVPGPDDDEAGEHAGWFVHDRLTNETRPAEHQLAAFRLARELNAAD